MRRLSAFENEGRRDFDIGAYADIDDAAYESLKPFVWPARKDAPAKTRFFADGGFFHSDGRARFIATAAREPVHAPSGDWPIRLNTGRVRDQWHTMTRTAKSPRLAGHRPEPTIELNAIDATQRGLQDGDIAEVTSAWGRAALRVHLSTALRQGEAFAPMHWTAQLSRAGRINAAVNPAVDPISGQPELKHTPVEVRRVAVAVAWHDSRSQADHAARGHLLGAHQGRRTTTPICWRASSLWPSPAARCRRRCARPIPVRGWTARKAWAPSSATAGSKRSCGIGKAHDEAARDRLAPFMAMAQLDSEQRRVLLHGGDAADRGGEICACFGVSCASVQTAIADGAMTLDAVGAVTKAGTSCGSCRPEIRALLRAARPRQAA